MRITFWIRPRISSARALHDSHADELAEALRDLDTIGDAGDLARRQSAADMRFAEFCNALTPERLAESRVTDRPGGSVSETVANLILHLAQHQVHHRGQAHVQLQDAGIAPPQLDEFHLEDDRAPSAAAYFA